MKKIIYTFLFLVFVLSTAFAQESKNPDWLAKLIDIKFKPFAQIQMWAVYTDGMELFDADNSVYETVDNRLNFTLHRARYGFNAQPYPNLKFNFAFASDFVGRDALSALDPGQNNGANPFFRLWQTFLQLRLKSGKETAFLTTGYLAPRIGRESNTNPLRSTSMEKAWSQNYLRRHLVGTGPGRALGINLGGLFYKRGRALSLKYDAGIFSPVTRSFGGNSTGKEAAVLVTGRTVISFGDPESEKYTLGHLPNYFGNRTGISIGLAVAAQGRTDLFKNSYTYGADFLVNFGQLNFDGDWHFLTRETTDGSQTAEANTGYIRVSYNYHLKNGYVFEPTATLVQYNGHMDEQGQAAATDAGMPAGEDQHIDLGFNFYFNPDLKIALHYTLRDGDAGFVGDGSTINNFFVTGAGPVRYGDWFGLGLNVIF
ncbi:MAG: hypothetical protein AAFZ15_22680 [Bacteroidota bacterium]